MATYKAPSMMLGSALFEWGRQTYVMGIVNVTPDSFSGDGLLREPGDPVATAVAQAKAQVAAGAHLIDVGGESTRPGSVLVSQEEELQRVIPVIRALVHEISIPISIDTCKSAVAQQAVEAGALLVNDVWGLQLAPDIAQVIAKYKVGVVLMHNRSMPDYAVQEGRLGGHYVGVEYGDLMSDIMRELEKSLDLAHKAHIPMEKIIIDPGFGFGKTVQQNIELLDRLGELQQLGYPILVGPSRKSFIGHVLKLPPEQRLEGTAAAVTLAIDRGADIVRVHDVAAMSRVVRLTDAVIRNRKPGH
ncbi:MAG: dihydropteroate synthase [Chloroflexi bacterium]|nr:dihydropteroate synthase [Chloroflexota bacterium]